MNGRFTIMCCNDVLQTYVLTNETQTHMTTDLTIHTVAIDPVEKLPPDESIKLKFVLRPYSIFLFRYNSERILTK